MTRPYRIALFGATGFTGILVAQYLHRQLAGTSLTWAIAGRNPDKLEALRRQLRSDSGAEPAVLRADVSDAASLRALASQCDVLITTVGPYETHGEVVVLACVREGTDYVDITGEPPFVERVRVHYGDEARAKKLRIVNCCGFDSIPHDLGVYYTIKHCPAGEPVTVEGFVEFHGGVSGGTWHSAIGILSRYFETRGSAKNLRQSADGRTVRSSQIRVRHEQEVDAWVVPLPTIDPQIVRRSALTLEEYGPDFRYGHYLAVRSLPMLAAQVLGAGGVLALSQFEATRNLLYRVYSPGDGPSAEQRAKHWFRVTFVAQSQSARIHTRVSGGDPGYDETAKMLGEAAICLVRDRDRLPQRYGVITPAAAYGEVLIDRLQRAGIRFELLPHA